MNADLYPLSFPYGATISFMGSVPEGGAADVRFRFEFNLILTWILPTILSR